MKILERLELIENRAKVARDDGSLRQDLGKVERITERVVGLTRSLNRLSAAYRELYPVRGDQCSALVPALQSVAATLSSLAEQVRITQQAGALPEFAQQLATAEKTVKTVEQSLMDVWASFRAQHQRPSVDRELLMTFQRAGLGVDHLLEQYDDADLKLQFIEGSSLPNAGAVDGFRGSLQSLAAASEGLADVVPESIARFLRLADTPQGAPLSAFTSEVQSFLQEHQIADRYTIRGR
ncbi:hypothetical protein KI427_09140 [Rhodococcus ruber]|uniref:hypothetical protein n=1 Tax=Rhodococcus ruber TaxID=1830 RepID=UPI00200F163B|nr:hypothetical protein [Rhodococcus ruber]UQB74496.1 hypothetical protein KI427_09140 [Rhodococcus ruber]